MEVLRSLAVLTLLVALANAQYPASELNALGDSLLTAATPLPSAPGSAPQRNIPLLVAAAAK